MPLTGDTHVTRGRTHTVLEEFFEHFHFQTRCVVIFVDSCVNFMTVNVFMKVLKLFMCCASKEKKHLKH